MTTNENQPPVEGWDEEYWRSLTPEQQEALMHDYEAGLTFGPVKIPDGVVSASELFPVPDVDDFCFGCSMDELIEQISEVLVKVDAVFGDEIDGEWPQVMLRDSLVAARTTLKTANMLSFASADEDDPHHAVIP